MDFTEETATPAVVASFEGAADPRLREVLGSLVRHLHGFVREVEPTFEEWQRALGFLTETGQRCDDTRQEFILLSDVPGVTMLVDAVNHRTASAATDSTVLGPFHMVASPKRELGDTIDLVATGEPCVVSGRVSSLDGTSLAGAQSTSGRPTTTASTTSSSPAPSPKATAGACSPATTRAASGSARSPRAPIRSPPTARWEGS
jgi:hydroxyquinol 1,2-dioxygenase